MGGGTHNHCCVPYFNGDSRKDPSLSLHCLPKDEMIRKNWIWLIKRDPGKQFKVKDCSVLVYIPKTHTAHFT